MDDTHKNSDDISVFDYIEIIVQRRRVIVGLTALFAVFGALVTYEPGRLHKIEANLLVGNVRELDSNLSKVLHTTPPIAAFLKSTDVAARQLVSSVPMTGIQDSIRLWDVVAPNRSLGDAVDAFGEATEIESAVEGVVTISASLEDSVMAEALMHAYTQEFIAYLTDVKRKELERDEAFLSGRIASLEEELRVASDSKSGAKRNYSDGLDDRAVDGLTLKLSWLQSILDVRQRIYSSLLMQRERLKLRGYQQLSDFEVLSYSRSRVTNGFSFSLWQRVLGAMAVGFFASVILAFLLEWVESARREGRWAALARAWKNEPWAG